MGNGYARQPAEGMDQIVQPILEMRRRLRELEALDGSQIYNTVQDLKHLLDGLLNQVNGIFSGYVSAGTTVTAGGDITSTAGRGSFASALVSTGAAATDLSAMAGLRQTVWQLYTGSNTGMYGYAPSTLASKTNLSESLPFTAADVYETIPYMYEYIGQVAIRDDADNPDYDPDYVVPTEIGLMAEYLVARNMGAFVVFNEDGSPKTIDYASFGAIANLVAIRDLNERLTGAGL